jgi:hypothetical protein
LGKLSAGELLAGELSAGELSAGKLLAGELPLYHMYLSVVTILGIDYIHIY